MSKRNRYDSLFLFYAGEIDPLALKAQALAESNLDPLAVSRCGAEGLAQFMPATFQELMGPADPFNPEVSIQAQALYMKQLLVRYGRDLEKAYAAYNWGMGNLDRCLQDHSGDWRGHLPDETAQYLARIAGLREELVREALPRA